MSYWRLTFILLGVLAGTAAARPFSILDRWRQSTDSRTTKGASLPAGYNASLAHTMMRYSVAAYRSNSSLWTWSCDVCRNLKTFSLQTVFFDNTYQVRVLVGYDSSLRAIVIAFRGTSTMTNWEGDFMAWPVKAKLFGSKAGKVHDGFYKMYLTLRQRVIMQVEAMMKQKKFASAQLYITGHSLGAALGTLCALEFSDRYPKRTLTMYNFGSPRVGNSQFVEYFTEKVRRSFRVVNTGDPVTKVPFEFMSYRHVPQRVVASDSIRHTNYFGITTKTQEPNIEPKSLLLFARSRLL